MLASEKVVLASLDKRHPGMFCRFDIEGNRLLATGTVGRALDQAICKVGLSQLEHPQRPDDLVCILDLELLGTDDAVQRLRHLVARQPKAGSQNPHQFDH